jgi:hypothetical protein
VLGLSWAFGMDGEIGRGDLRMMFALGLGYDII